MDNIFGERLRDLRLEKGLTLKDLSKQINVSKSMLSSYELGGNEPTMTKLIEIAKFFDVSIDYLCGLTDY